VAYQHLLRAEGVPVRASRRWVGDPLPSMLYEITDRHLLIVRVEAVFQGAIPYADRHD